MFQASSEEQDVCSQCLSAEFASGELSSEVSHEELVREYAGGSTRRQQARARRMGRAFSSSTAFSMMGKVRCGFAVLLFLICTALFILGDGEQKTFLNQLAQEEQLAISISVCGIAAALLLPSYSRHKLVVGLSSLFIVVMGVFMPSLWHHRTAEVSSAPGSVQEGEATDGESVAEDGRYLKDEELTLFHKLHDEKPRGVHYVVFMRCDIDDSHKMNGTLAFGRMEQSTRNLIKSSLSRLMHGAEVLLNNSRDGNGVIFTIADAPGQRINMEQILKRYGRVYYKDTRRGVYELALESDKVQPGADVDPQARMNPHSARFAEANMKALNSLDSKLVADAARKLASANTQVLRGDICDNLLRTLESPWEAEPDAHQALVEALTVYARKGDTRIVAPLKQYFDQCIKYGRGISSPVVLRLVEEAPEQVVDAVLRLWAANPVAWNEITGKLGVHAEKQMVGFLERPNLPMERISDILTFLHDYGTELSLPVVERYATHEDKTVSAKAEGTASAIRKRVEEARAQ